jgi:predicted ABC-type ATPase
LPTVIVIAGPNGAGKTTFAREYLAAEDRQFEFVNADEIAQGLDKPSDIRAGRMMLDRIERLIGTQSDLAIETTLASLGYAQKIPAWRRQGYLVSLVYLQLDSVEQSIARAPASVSQQAGMTYPRMS